jgi:hypothetical protein
VISQRLEGIAQLRFKLGALDPEGKTAVRRVVKRSLLRIEGNAKRNLTQGPYRALKTGRLRNSQTHVVDPDGFGGAAGTNVKYGPAVHFGTRRMKARPWLAAAANEERPKFLADMHKEVIAAAQRMGRR